LCLPDGSDILHRFTLVINLTCSSYKKRSPGSVLFHLGDCFSSSCGWSVFIRKIYGLFWRDVGENWSLEL